MIPPQSYRLASAPPDDALGHGIGCITVGGRIMALTAMRFRRNGAKALTAAGGQLVNLRRTALFLRRRGWQNHRLQEY